VYDPHRTCGVDEKHEFPGLALKSVTTVCQWFDFKITAIVSWFGHQSQGRLFGDLCLKITATILWFGSQNQVAGGLSICTSKPMSR
jgi:hypothetical protein